MPDLDGGIELYRDVLGAKVSEVVVSSINRHDWGIKSFMRIDEN